MKRPQISLPHEREPKIRGWLRIGFWVCVAISVAAVIRRLVALAAPPQLSSSRMAGLDEVFASHAALTLAHILPALAFVLIVPFAILRRFSRLSWPEPLVFALGAVVSITAYAMAAYAIGGWAERSAVLFYNTLFLFSMGRAWLCGRRGQSFKNRRWLIRSVAILLGIATTRPVMGIFFATSSVTHLSARQFFGLAFWIGFSTNWLIVEIWLHSNRQSFEH